jgi:crossover junction endonuclease MUS81
MKACPLEFQHPSQAQQLNGLGPKLCDRLTDKLKAYCREHSLLMPEPPGQGQYTILPSPMRIPEPIANCKK